MSEDISSFLFVCPQCGEEIELPEAFWGMPYTCKQCSHQTVAKGQQQKECPWCGELIKAKAKICRFCQRDVENEKTSQSILEKPMSTNPVYNENIKQRVFSLLPNEQLLGEKTVVMVNPSAQDSIIKWTQKGYSIKWTNKRLVFCEIPNVRYLLMGVYSSSNEITFELAYDEIIEMVFDPCTKAVSVFSQMQKELTIRHVKSDANLFLYAAGLKKNKEFLQQIYEWWTSHYKE